MGQLGMGETIAWNPWSKEPPAEAQAGWRPGDGTQCSQDRSDKSGEMTRHMYLPLHHVFRQRNAVYVKIHER